MLPLTAEAIREKTEALSLPILAQAGLDLVELDIVLLKNEVRLSFAADRPMGGITIEECAESNRAIAQAIEADGF